MVSGDIHDHAELHLELCVVLGQEDGFLLFVRHVGAAVLVSLMDAEAQTKGFILLEKPPSVRCLVAWF